MHGLVFAGRLLLKGIPRRYMYFFWAWGYFASALVLCFCRNSKQVGKNLTPGDFQFAEQSFRRRAALGSLPISALDQALDRRPQAIACM